MRECNFDMLIKIANLFDTSIDYLLSKIDEVFHLLLQFTFPHDIIFYIGGEYEKGYFQNSNRRNNGAVYFFNDWRGVLVFFRIRAYRRPEKFRLFKYERTFRRCKMAYTHACVRLGPHYNRLHSGACKQRQGL